MSKAITQTIGLDLGDRFSTYCVVDQTSGDQVEAGRLRTTPEALERFFTGRGTARTVLEVGAHSPWASRVVARGCAETYVANTRELHFIFKNQRKSDTVDAELLARVGRLDPKLLKPVRHRGVPAQQDLALVRARAALVGSRTKLVNALRGQVKAVGARLPRLDAKSIRYDLRAHLPEGLQEALVPLLRTIEFLSEEIAGYDREVERRARERYPETGRLTQVGGVGALTALAYVLTLEDPGHFARSRDVGPYLGLVPKRDQSGETDKELRVTKAGDRLLRTLLVQCAQHILGRQGPDCDLKRYGERIAGKGSKIAKRKAVIAVARKLAVLLHHLWQSQEAYDPHRNRTSAADATPTAGGRA